ncbi:MAG: Asp-tRNA(Asn)/Glu-tRNA(Gln) amidotransferase subunit GatB [Planctomycetota bacterium]|jgi:aspartyl-tRNA(Asn)/glutamyl-tRNA(Gln) amidotransferase subunit B
MSSPPYETVIGLEVHVQLATRSKLFCGCSTEFGAEPNTQTCPVCIGMPGVLPVMNRRAYELALKTAVALNCQIPRFTKWDRKQYYYPDLPKGYQISQFDLPMSLDGYLPIGDPKGAFEPKRVGIIRVHLEEDAGKSMHDELSGTADSRIDLNRAGTPLLEIVSQPDLRSPDEAKAYLTELKLLLNYLGVSDCNMQEGSLRVDANINLHIDTPEGNVATPIVEVKNMNSFRAVERALGYEAQRQFEVWQQTGAKLGDVPKETRGWDESAQLTRGQRSKEESSDYRYFPEPDLVPVTTTAEDVERVRESLGELPAALRVRLEETYGITPYDSDVLVNQGRALVDYYVELAEICGDGKLAGNWVQQDVLRTLNQEQIDVTQFPVSAAAMAELIGLVRNGKLTTSRGREVLAVMIRSGKSAEGAMAGMGIRQVDESALEDLCRELVQSNPKIVTQVKQGKLKAIGALIGQAKKENANVNPGRVREICLELIDKL